MTGYVQPEDIVNRGLQILQLPRIRSLATDTSPAAIEMSFLYDKVRRELLQEHLWVFAIRNVALRPLAATTMLLEPAPWQAGIPYDGGSIVSYGGVIYIAEIDDATGTPGVGGSGWEQYFGPLTVTPWDVPVPPQVRMADQNPYLPTNVIGEGQTPYGQGLGSTGYYTGELTYIPKGDGTQMTFRAVVSSLGLTASSPLAANLTGLKPPGPLMADPWDPSITYAQGQIVSWPPAGLIQAGITPIGVGAGVLGPGIYQSTVDLNVGNNPLLVEANAYLMWSAANAYSAGDYAWGSDSQVYQCLVSNTGVNPVTDTLFAYWIPMTMWVGTWSSNITPSPRAFANEWQYIPGAVENMQIVYPLAAGPIQDTLTRNAFRLPANFLREAPQMPKYGGTGYLGAPQGGIWFDDWEYDDVYLVSGAQQPILYRFIADVTYVPKFDALFCSAFAARLAREAQPLLQPDRNDLWTRAEATYERAIERAQLINSILAGSVQLPVDEYIACRL